MDEWIKKAWSGLQRARQAACKWCSMGCPAGVCPPKNSAALVPADNLTPQKEVLSSKMKEQKCIVDKPSKPEEEEDILGELRKEYQGIKNSREEQNQEMATSILHSNVCGICRAMNQLTFLMWLSWLKNRSYQLVLTKGGENRKTIMKYPLKNPPKILSLWLLLLTLVNNSMYQIISQEEQDWRNNKLPTLPQLGILWN